MQSVICKQTNSRKNNVVIGWGLIPKIKGVTEEEAHLSWQEKEALENEFSPIY